MMRLGECSGLGRVSGLVRRTNFQVEDKDASTSGRPVRGAGLKKVVHLWGLSTAGSFSGVRCVVSHQTSYIPD